MYPQQVGAELHFPHFSFLRFYRSNASHGCNEACEHLKLAGGELRTSEVPRNNRHPLLLPHHGVPEAVMNETLMTLDAGIH